VEQGQLLADLAALKDLETQWAKANADANYEETVSNNTIQRAQIKLQIAQLNVDDLKARGASQAALQIAALQVQLAQMDLDEVKANPTLHTASAKAQELELAMADAQLKAPIAGYIVSAPRSGQSVRKTADAFLIGDVNQLEVGAAAVEETLKQLAEGLTVTVVLEAQPEKSYAGVIRQLPYPYGNGGDGSTDVRVTLNVKPAEAGLKLGDRMLITAVLQDKINLLWLPPQAIRTVGGRTFVVTQDAVKGQQRVDVTLGLQTHERVEILAGLTDGQVVVGP
jgi:multidrug resistance efflux pump